MGDMALAVMPNAVLRLAIGFNLGETRAVELLYIVKIGRDEDDGTSKNQANRMIRITTNSIVGRHAR